MAVKRIYIQQSKPMAFNPGSKEFTETFLVDLDDPQTSIEEIERHRDYPIQFETHADHPTYYCISAQLDQDTRIPNVRSGTSRWSTAIPEADLVDGKPKLDPDRTKRPVRAKWGTYKSERTVRMAYGAIQYRTPTRGERIRRADPDQLPPVADVPITTTAGESIFMRIPEDYRMISFQKYVEAVPEFMAKNSMLTNSDEVKFRGIKFAPLELLATDIDVDGPNFAMGKAYYTFTWVWLVAKDQDGWLEKRRNAGFSEKVIIFVDANGKEYDRYISGVTTTKEVLRQIEIGPVYNRHFPNAPVLIRPNGKAFRARAEGDANDPETWTGEILTTDSRTGQGITDAEWKEAERKFSVRLAIPFKKYFPYR